MGEESIHYHLCWIRPARLHMRKNWAMKRIIIYLTVSEENDFVNAFRKAWG